MEYGDYNVFDFLEVNFLATIMIHCESFDVASGSVIMSCIKPLMVY